MKAVKVQYTVKPAFIETNKENIRKVMDAIRSNPIDGMLYASFQLDDGQTFVHINMAKDEETMARLNEVAEFNDFRTALKHSEPVTPPHSTNLSFVGSTFDL
jgi:hypothetical protein